MKVDNNNLKSYNRNIKYMIENNYGNISTTTPERINL